MADKLFRVILQVDDLDKAAHENSAAATSERRVQ